MPPVTAAGMPPTTNPRDATTRTGVTAPAATQAVTPAATSRLEAQSSAHACRPLIRSAPGALDVHPARAALLTATSVHLSGYL
jgi:hypothetical protein